MWDKTTEDQERKGGKNDLMAHNLSKMFNRASRYAALYMSFNKQII